MYVLYICVENLPDVLVGRLRSLNIFLEKDSRNIPHPSLVSDPLAAFISGQQSAASRGIFKRELRGVLSEEEQHLHLQN